ncbi:4Fe-4S dicluster domain-containing protein [Vibrio sp. MA40-2]|uniref:electron transfer flavoprotein-ubiquinone oxidoreductase n=1 Tax=Vibrio sp. MA40-2 TaxID=3391828 RepID=UPI0039A75690
MEQVLERDEMTFDVIIVGAGPAGLIAAYRLLKQASLEDKILSICVLEKGSEIGAHLLSGALFDCEIFNQLFTEDERLDAPLGIGVNQDTTWLLKQNTAITLPHVMTPKSLHNKDMRIVSLGRLCQWLGEKVEALGGEIFTGFTAAELVYQEETVIGVLTGDMGLDKQGQTTDRYEPGMKLFAKQTLLCEGSRGHLGKQVLQHYQLDQDADRQHYSIGFKEKWKVAENVHHAGLAVHGTGWPLPASTGGGFYLYHADNNEIWLGLIADLNYKNPYFNPYDAFQQLKHHPKIAALLENAQRVAYGARSITKGGFNSLPNMVFPGGFILGCNAGTLDTARMKGIHTAMYSALCAADTIIQLDGKEQGKQTAFDQHWQNSDIYQQLKQTRSFGPALHRLGPIVGGAYNRTNELVNYKLPAISDLSDDRLAMTQAATSSKHADFKADKTLSFSIADSVYLANTEHDEEQPCHLIVSETEHWLIESYTNFAEPAQRYCPAGVYEVVEQNEQKKLQINPANCLHCKTCDIKDPRGKITWTPPQGGSGPNYQNM